MTEVTINIIGRISGGLIPCRHWVRDVTPTPPIRMYNRRSAIKRPLTPSANSNDSGSFNSDE